MRKRILLILVIASFFCVSAEALNVTIGNGYETARLPVDMANKNSIFETLYYPAEIGMGGTITAVTFYNNFVDNLFQQTTKIWLGETNSTNLYWGWIPSTNLTLVYDGSVNYLAGQNAITIPFSTPYIYNNSNLVMLVQKIDTSYHSPSNNFFCQTVGVDRSRFLSSDGSPYNPAYSGMTGAVSAQFPKTTFSFSHGLLSNDMASVALTGNLYPIVDQVTYYSVSVLNWGTAISSPYSVKLMSGQTELATVDGPELSPGCSQEVQIQWTPLSVGQTEIYAKVVSLGDQNDSNDNTNTLSLNPSTFEETEISIDGVLYSSTTWGDYNNDGNLDILLTGINSSYNFISKVYCNNGNDSFADINAGLIGVYHGSTSWGDYDNDGDQDILLTGGTSLNSPYNPVSKIYRNNGYNSFTDINAGLFGVVQGAATWGDFNNDGYLDIFLSGLNNGYAYSKLYRNNGNGSFIEVSTNILSVYQSSAAWGDYNNDGYLDILLSGTTGTGMIVTYIYRNNGNNTFTYINPGLIGVYNGSVAWGDYSNDSNMDILLTGSTSLNNPNSTVTKIYRNNGNGTFSDINTSISGTFSSAAWGDYENDGDLDILLTGSGATVIFQNEGNDVFLDSSVRLVGIVEGSAAWDDYDNDGDLDILLAGSFNTKVYKKTNNFNNWITFKTRGILTNADGVGARIRLGTSQTREIASGSGWTNRYAHFGIGNQSVIDSVYVYWPNTGVTATIPQVQSNQMLTITETSSCLINFLPNGGQILPGASGQNNTYQISWTIINAPTNIHHVSLYYSIDGGVTYPYLISDNEVNDGSYDWIVPSISSNLIRLNIQLKDVNGLTLAEQHSASNITIDTNPPIGSIFLTSPNNGIWINSTPEFRWSSSGLSDVVSMAIVIDGMYLIKNIPAYPWRYQIPENMAISAGWHTWTIRGLDIAGNWVQASQTWSIRIDVAAPSQFSLIAPINSAWVNTSTPILSWEASMDSGSGLQGYNVHINDSYSSVSANSIQYSPSPLVDGRYFWFVQALDNVGNSQVSSTTRLLRIDTTPPNPFSLSIPQNNAWMADSLITFSWNLASDNGIGQVTYELWIDGVCIVGDLSEMHYQLSHEQILQNGTHNWYVKAIDGLGNSRSSSLFTLQIDRVSPADFALLTPINNSYFNMPTPTFTWNPTTDSGSGMSHYELWIDGVLNIDNLTQTSTSPANALTEGAHPWYVVAVDNVGNRKQSTAIWTTIGDWNPPTQPVLTSPINNQIVSISRPTLVWQKSTDAGTGVHHYSLYIDNVLVIASFIPSDINAQVVNIQSPNTLANGNHTWYVKAFDNAGGESSSAYGSFMVDVDTTPPTSSISNPIVNQYIGGVSYLISGTASDNTGGSGVQKVEISFDGGNNWLLTTHTSRSVARGESQFTSNQTPQLQRAGNKDNLLSRSVQSQDGTRDVYNWQYNWTGYQTGSVTIKTRATDMNNNVESPPYSLPVIVERIAPVIQSLTTNPSYAKAGTVTFSIVFQTGAHCNGMNNSVTPTVTITPAGGTARAVTQTNYQGNTWTGQTTIAQSDLNGTAVINVSNAKDNINNLMLPNATHTFVIDTIAPTAFNLISPATGAWLNVNRPQLTWGAATDVNSGIDHYALEIDGSTGSPGISSISPTLNTIQPAAALTMGTHNWRIKAYDRAGNSTWSSATFSFGLDLTPPVSAIAAPTNNSTIGGLSYTISGTSSDGTGSSSSAVANVQIRINSGAWLQAVNTGTNLSTWNYAWTGYASGTYTIQSRATDNAGNIETSPLTTTVTVNLNPPTVQTITIMPNPAKAGVITCTALFTANASGLNYSVHPTLWFTTPNATIVNFVETSYSGNQWVGTATIASTTQNGTATVHVTGVKDNINNVMAPNQNAGTFVIDTVPPTVSSITVTPQITNVRTDLSVQVNFAADTAGLNSTILPVVTIIPLGATASNYISVLQTGYNVATRIWTGVATINAQSLEGIAAIKVASATDLAGNAMQAVTLQNQLTIDRSAPLAFNVLQPVAASWTSNRQPQISWSASSDNISGLSGYKLYINDNQVGTNILPTVTTTTCPTSLADGAYQLRISALDNAQAPNIRLSGTSTVLFNVDGTAPTSIIASPANGFIVIGNSVIISGNAHDGVGVSAGIGVKYVLLSKNGGAVWDTVYVAPSQTPGSVTWNKVYNNLTPGNHTITAKSIDWLTNTELPTSSILITVQASSPVANFSATPTTGTAPLSVNFTDLSTLGSWPIVSWEWDFENNGTVDSNQQNPSHIFARGTYTVTLTVKDMYNTSNTMTITNMISSTNQVPHVTQALPDLLRDEDFTPIVIDLSSHFADGDGDVLSYSVVNTPSEISAVVSNNTLTISSVLNYFGSALITVTANDNYQLPVFAGRSGSKNRDTCSDAFTLTINPVNDAPIVNLPDSFTFVEDTSLVIDIAPFVNDVDNTTLTISSTGSSHITVAMNGSIATLTASSDWNGTESVSFAATDGQLQGNDQTNVIVTPDNDAPVLDLPASFTFAEDGSLPINLALYASDVDNANLTLTISGNTNVTVGITNLNVTLGSLLNWNGTELLTFTVSDNMGRAVATDSADIIVTSVNDDPVISSFSPADTTLTLQLNGTQSFSVIANDVDSDISYSWFINGVNQNVSLSAFEYQFTQSSTHIVKVAVTDGFAIEEQIWTVSVPVANDDPFVTPLITRLYPNYPNPFNPETTIQYSLETPGWVNISIYNISGQLIKELKRGNENSGRHSLIWNGRDNDDNAVATGLYYVRMRTNDSTSIIKMTLMK